MTEERKSRFIEKLRRVDRAAVQPMGFRAGGAAPSVPRMLLVVSLESGVAPRAADIRDADAVLLRPGDSRLSAEAVQKTVGALKEKPWGAYLEDGDAETVASLAGVGCDFLVMAAAGPVAAAPHDGKIGAVLQVESSMDDGLLRAVNNLPVDAVLVADSFEGGSLIWHQLMIFQHLANLFIGPLIVSVPADITEAELKALWEAGVDGVVVVAAAAAGGISELRAMIDKLPVRTAHKRGRVEARLSRPGGESPTSSPDVEEDDEDDDYE
ncbi:MAG: hypothetical protein ABID71_05255 [Chloroflexota bacterium]